MIIIIILRVLSGDPSGYGAASAQILAIYENFQLESVSVFFPHNTKFVSKKQDNVDASTS